jgi:hypothetical protein
MLGIMEACANMESFWKPSLRPFTKKLGTVQEEVMTIQAGH